ncbi:hypothetical protein H0B56_02745 [Haloechinothrix sp. YIM 98757]|uniref:LVIVD repeat-containing protein n=1 Tax=Haloechinothrix aidingensis TaxID=2752311 RepID=A0A838A6F2_9PSEU|nr:hypothetical protein [Haloechinothrix aidingensis]MBA0124455.1 hypothetical protein [Haloechinothrix aidingensis]
MTVRTRYRYPALLSAPLLLAAGLSGLTASAQEADTITHTDNIQLDDRSPFAYGTDLAFNGDLVAAGAGAWEEDARSDSGVRIFERNSDGSLDELSFLNCSAWHADVDWVQGRYIVQSSDNEADNSTCEPGRNSAGIRVIDAENPRRPSSVGFAETIHGSHNLTAVGDTGLVYNSSYNLGDPTDVDGLSIIDVAADPEDPPVRFLEFPDADSSSAHPEMTNNSGTMPTSPGCHDIGLDLDHDRAFCAGITETMIWDISDPRNPAIETIIHNPDVSIHHGAQANQDGDVLLVQDEWLGAAGANSGCLAPHQPSGTIWFYDISDPDNPQPRSYWSAPEPDPTADFCTTHFFGTFEMPIDGEQHDMVVTSYYQHGVWVADFTDPASVETHAFYEPDGANFWSAYPYKGRLYANSFSPATLTGSDPASADKGGIWTFRLDGYGEDVGEHPGRPAHAGP